MEETLDAGAWLAIIGVVVGFFLVPAAMLGYDLRRQSRTVGSTARDQPDVSDGSDIAQPSPRPVACSRNVGRVRGHAAGRPRDP